MDLMMHAYLREAIIADPHPLFREGVEARLRSWFPEIAIRHAADSDGLSECLRTGHADLVISEMLLPPGDILSLLERFNGSPPLPFVIISQYKDPKLVRELCKLGVLAVLHKGSGAEILQAAVRHALRQEIFLGPGITMTGQAEAKPEETDPRFKDYFQLRFELTRREIEVLSLIKRGMKNREIAEALFISEQTVSVHRKNIFRKVGVNNTQKLLRITYEHHLA